MAKKGHSFPPAAGFTGSSGRVQNVRGYTRKVHKAQGGMVSPLLLGRSGPKAIPQVSSAPKTPPTGIKAPPRIMSAPKMPPRPPGRIAAYAKGGYVTETIGDQGNAAVKRGNPPITETDKKYGGTGPLTPGYAKGGFNRTPKFGK